MTGRCRELLYRTTDGAGLYQFRFERVESRWHSVIVSQPGYGHRSSSLVHTHRLRRRDGALLVCWNPLPTEFASAQRISALWAEGTQRYIAEGRFPALSDLTRLRRRG